MTKAPLWERYINILGPLVMILLLCIVMAIAEPRFFGVTNMMIIPQDAAIYMVMGMAMTLVITGKGIDLSIGSVATLSGICMAMLIKDHDWGTVSRHADRDGRRHGVRHCQRSDHHQAPRS